jgi:hypothetical protein
MTKSRLVRRIPLALLVLLLIAGCGKPARVADKPDFQAEASPQTNNPPALLEAASGSAPAAPEAPDAAPEATAGASQSTATTLNSLTQSVRRYTVEKRQLPKTLDDVVRAGYLPSLPNAPQGKKFALDLKSVRVILVDR